MSGWIKMGTGLRTHPKVGRMAFELKSDRLRVVGALHAVWCVFDEHSTDGRLPWYTLAMMDEAIGWKGFSQAMTDIGWLVVNPDDLEAPEYEEHNGTSAKRRALDSKRKGSGKDSADDADAIPKKRGRPRGKDSASDAEKMRNRGEEEERKNSSLEEGNNSTTVTPAAAVCRALREAGIPGVQSLHPTLLALVDAGATPQEFADAAPSSEGKRDRFTYVLSVVEGRRRDAAEKAKTLPHGAIAQAAEHRPDTRAQDYFAEQEERDRIYREQRAARLAARQQGAAS